ncbi:MAG: chloride channel protein [Chromatiales bacterium]|nr:chloride channel protein [Chromatiales bacterium]
MQDSSHFRFIFKLFASWLERFQLRLARADALLALSLLGLISGLVAGLVIIVFRLALEWTQALYLGEGSDGFGALAPIWRFLLPVGGGLLIGLMMQYARQEWRSVGVSHVMERLQYHQGRFPLPNAVLQFFGAWLALASGHSVGKEGPVVHLGVAASNIPAQRLGLPNNSLRVLAACGTAAAIAAIFNTPLAGVAFAMEVLMFGYTVAAFAPVLLAAVSATVLAQLVFGNELAFVVPSLSLGNLSELPLVLVLGILIGILAATFIRLLRSSFLHTRAWPWWLRGLVAGLVVGTAGYFVPEIMGLGYDTVNRLILGELALWLMLAIVVLKLLASTVTVGMGIPGGLIGPALVVGAACGGSVGYVASYLGWVEASSIGFYVLLGMGAMMAGTLQAPLAGLIAILELTGNPGTIFPGMLAVITATLVSAWLHGQESMFQAMLMATGRDYRNDPLVQSLRRVGVAAVMDKALLHLPPRVSRRELEDLLMDSPRWILVEAGEALPQLLAAMDVAIALKEQPELDELDLNELPAKRLEVATVDLQATLQDARECLQDYHVEALLVVRRQGEVLSRIYGVLTASAVENSYHY